MAALHSCPLSILVGSSSQAPPGPPALSPALLITVLILGCLLAVPELPQPDPTGFPAEVAKALKEALSDHCLGRQGAGMKKGGNKGIESPLLFPLRRTTRRKYWKEGREIAR